MSKNYNFSLKFIENISSWTRNKIGVEAKYN